MGVKYKKSVSSYNRTTRKTTVSHFWLSGVSTKELLEDIEKDSVRPKQKQKARVELTKRGVSYEQKAIDKSSESEI
jgi:hypothetical protein